MEKTIKKYFWFLRKQGLKMLLYIASIKKRILVIGSQWVNKQF